MPRRKMLEECPNCSSTWGPGSEEWQFQQCDSCGWPDPGCEDFMRNDDDFDPYDDDETNDPLAERGIYDEPDYDQEGE